jgi:Na+-driven multidrug efflux pump
LPVFFIFTLPFFFDLDGIFMAIPMAEFVTFIIAVILYRRFSPEKIIHL